MVYNINKYPYKNPTLKIMLYLHYGTFINTLFSNKLLVTCSIYITA